MINLLVSIIVPVYGVEQYLDKCVKSIVDQTYKNIEIILVDDGSPDNCPKMCDDWAEKDNRIRVIHKENGGQGTARNMALDVASGDYILFVDSDDEIELSMVEKLIVASNHGEYDLVLCSPYYFNKLHKVKGSWYEKSLTVKNNELIKRYLQDKKIITGPVCKFFKKSIFNNIRFPDFRANEDAYIMHRLLGNCSNAYFLNEHLYTVNLHEESTEGKKFNKNKLHLIDCTKDLREYIKVNYSQYSNYVEDRVLNSAIYLLERLYNDSCEDLYPEIEQQLLNEIRQEVEYLKSINFDSYDKNADLIIYNLQRYKINLSFKQFKTTLKKKIKKIIVSLKKR